MKKPGFFRGRFFRLNNTAIALNRLTEACGVRRTMVIEVKKIISVLVFIGLLFSVSTACFADDIQSYVSTVYNDRTGLPTGEANDVVQTPDGYIWIGSYAGLIRYDGTAFRNFSEEGAILTSTVRSMFVDSTGRLWAGSNDKGVFCMENGEFRQPEGQPEDSFVTIRYFAEGENGDIFVCSSSGLAKISGGIMTVFDTPEISGETVYSAAVDSFGRIWCATNSGCCVIRPDGALAGLLDSGKIFSGGENIYSITTGDNGEIWFGSDSNVLAEVSFTGEDLSPENFNITYHNTGSVFTHDSLERLSDGGIGVNGLRGFGIQHGSSFTEFGENQGASSVEGSCIDYEGNIWLASSTNGVLKFTKGCYSTPNISAGLSGKALNAFTGQGGYFFMGTDNGLIVCDESWNQVTNELTELLNGQRIRHIISDSRGYVWLASYSDTPVIRYDPADGEIAGFTLEDGLADRSARTLLEMSDGSIAVGMQNGLSIISPEGKIVSIADLPYPAILCMTEAENGALFAGSDGGGVYEITGGRVSNTYGSAEGLDNGIILRIVPDTEKGCYFVCTSSGMFYFSGGRFRKLTNLKKSSGNIFDIYLSDDKLFFLQNSGISCIPRSDVIADNGAASLQYGFEHGLTGSLYANTWHWLSPDNKLYLSTSSGVSVFGFSQPESVQPKGIVNSIIVDGTEYDHPESITVGQGQHRLTVDFAALSYTGTTRLSIGYQLNGFDEKETIITDKSGQVSYTNLPGGEYTFSMRIFLTDDPAECQYYDVKIIKDRKLTEQVWFAPAVAVAGLMLAVGITLLALQARLRAMERRQKQYQEIIDQSLKTFAGTIDAKDKYTNGHSLRVAKYSQELARRMNMNKSEQERIYYIAMLHDIGKIGVPDSILNKPGKLTDEERKIIQQHPATGAEILKNYTALKDVAYGAKYHHERYDGTGYCEGISGKDIPLVARIIGVADTYDAMSSKRCYRDPLSSEYIVGELKRVAGTQLDPEIVPYMIEMIEDGIAPINLPEDGK